MIIEHDQWKDFKGCPKLYYLRHRAKMSPSIPDNAYFRLYTNLMNRFFSMFSNTWKFKTPYMPPEYIREKFSFIFEQVSGNIDWTGPLINKSKEQTFNDTLGDICAIMDSNNQNYFLNTKSSVEMEVTLGNGHILKGSIDFINRTPVGDNDTVFIGMGSKAIKRKIPKESLFFYATLYYYHFKKIPGLGLFYYRFNTFQPVEFNEQIMESFMIETHSDIVAMCGSKFTATPNSKTCDHCGYRTSCETLIKKRASRAKPVITGIYDREGVQEFGF